jgi:hypothetical protein
MDTVEQFVAQRAEHREAQQRLGLEVRGAEHKVIVIPGYGELDERSALEFLREFRHLWAQTFL